ncbi:MAG: glycoside hydrolase family 97 protein [Bacteroidales bacterium]|nr:glycoside hydrolase family 97 protein [Bacteroidales bacterium]
MKKLLTLTGILAFVFFFSACSPTQNPEISSPDGRLQAQVFLLEDGQAAYKASFDGLLILDTSALGFEYLDMPPLSDDLRIQRVRQRSFSETWEMPWGEQRYVENTFNEMRVSLRERGGLRRKFDLVFRLYDDGLAFRFHFPRQRNMTDVFITEEHTLFNLTGDHMVWWTPGDWDIYEHLNSTTQFSEIDALSKRDHPNLAQTYIPYNAVNTPVSMRTDDGLHLSFHEAALIDYSGITLGIDKENLSMRSILVGTEREDYKVVRKTPFSTPWRMIQVAERAGDLIESRIILNLNEPNKLGDVSWLKPAKYMGIWWEMHLGKSSWDYTDDRDFDTWEEAEPHGRHGATTENAIYYIDFAAKHGIDALLIEGWYTGWEHWIGHADREGIYDFVTPYPDFDLEKVTAYARSKGVRLVMHHETSSAVTTYEQQLDTAYALMSHFGYDMVKTGYVGTIIPEGEYHHGQWMVNHYMRVLKKAAEHRVMVNSHEPIMATGLRRTYPNDATREALRGQEFNAWATDGGNPPGHLPIVAFTRMLAGPIDYTPGIFNIKLDPYRPNNQVNTTLAQQLALYVVIYSPMQMVADLPQYYEGHPAFQFIKDVGVDWEHSRVLNGEIGQYVTIVREERETGNWFLGSITNEEARELSIATDFLDPGKSYAVTLYADGSDAHWDKNPTSYTIETLELDHTSTLILKLAPGGGAAVSFMVKD